eukprot:gene7575-10319_t
MQCVGQIEGGYFGSNDYLYCKYSFQYGLDWTIAGGLEMGISQVSCRSSSGMDNMIVWNFPVDLSFHSSSISGWPRMALTVHGVDFFGNDVIKGYCSVLIPITSGQHQLEVDLYAPLAQSTLNHLISTLLGNPPEFFDPKFVCQSEGREVSRVQKSGKVIVNISVITKVLMTYMYVTKLQLFRYDQDRVSPAEILAAGKDSD